MIRHKDPQTVNSLSLSLLLTPQGSLHLTIGLETESDGLTVQVKNTYGGSQFPSRVCVGSVSNPCC